MIGINSLLEEEVEPQFSIIDLFVYDVSINYSLGDFGLYFGFENFINFGLQEAEVIPVPEFSNQIVSQITYELDSPFLISLGVTFTF